MIYEPKKPDLAIVPMKPTNKAGLQMGAESGERRAGTEGNADQQSTHGMQIRDRVSRIPGRALHGAKGRTSAPFTALSHYVDVDLLRLSFHVLKRQAAPGVEGGMWRDYEAELQSNLRYLQGRLECLRLF